jgi:succinyl-CoA synthetase beta subunit
MQLLHLKLLQKEKSAQSFLVAEDVYYPGETSEFYVSVLLNRATGRMIMYSTEGGMDIEEVAEHTPI